MTAYLSLDQLDRATRERLLGEAQRRGIDVSSVAAQLLAEALASTSAPADSPIYHDLDFLAGTWSDEEASKFREAIADFGRIEDSLWP